MSVGIESKPLAFELWTTFDKNIKNPWSRNGHETSGIRQKDKIMTTYSLAIRIIESNSNSLFAPTMPSSPLSPDCSFCGSGSQLHAKYPLEWYDCVLKANVSQHCMNVGRLSSFLQRHRLQWFSHVLRRVETGLAKKSLSSPPYPDWKCRLGG